MVLSANGSASYVMTSGGLLYALHHSAEDVHQTWVRNMGAGAPRGVSPVLSPDGSMVLAPTGGSQRQLVAVDTSSAVSRWSYRASSPPSGSPVFFDYGAQAAARGSLLAPNAASMHVFATFGSTLVAIDGDTGAPLWRCISDSGAPFVGRVALSQDGSSVYAATSIGAVYALKAVQGADSKCVQGATGGEPPKCGLGPVGQCNLWVSSTSSGHPTAAPPVVAGPVVDEMYGRLLVSTGQWADHSGMLVGFDLSEHAPQPQTLFESPFQDITGLPVSLQGPAAVAVYPGTTQQTIVLGDSIGRVFALHGDVTDAAPFVPRWVELAGQDVGSQSNLVSTASPPTTNGVVVLINTQDVALALDVHTGSIVWAKPHPDTPVPNPKLPASPLAVARNGQVRYATRGAQFVAVASGCPGLATPVNGSIMCALGIDGLPSCSYACAAEHLPVPEGHPMDTTCLLGGAWSNGPVTCQLVQCQYSAWSAYGACDVPCGGGEQSRLRNVTGASPSQGLQFCTSLSQDQSCNNQECPPPSAKSKPFVQYAVTIRVRSVSDFGSQQRKSFRQNIASAAGVSESQVLITSVQLVSGTRRLETASRRVEGGWMSDWAAAAGRLASSLVSSICGWSGSRRLQEGQEQDLRVDFRIEVDEDMVGQLSVIATRLIGGCESGAVQGVCAPASDLEIVADPQEEFRAPSNDPDRLSDGLIGTIVLGSVIVLAMIGVAVFVVSQRYCYVLDVAPGSNSNTRNPAEIDALGDQYDDPLMREEEALRRARHYALASSRVGK